MPFYSHSSAEAFTIQFGLATKSPIQSQVVETTTLGKAEYGTILKFAQRGEEIPVRARLHRILHSSDAAVQTMY
jgi:hypothetical protein